MNGAPATPSYPLEVDDLKVWYSASSGLLRRRTRWVHAVDGVSIRVRERETFALVGESGSGKTSLVRAVARLTPATAGRIKVSGQDVTTLRGDRLRRIRRFYQVVFQDPYSSLNPKQTIGEILATPLRVHGLAGGERQRDRVKELLEQVGLDARAAIRYPHEFSGGQRQRIGIARALAVEPQLLILDEPVSALDVSIQAQVINLLERLQSELGLSFLLIAHDLGLVRHIAHRVAVMYLGKVVESGGVDELFAAPVHPYTIALQSAVPVVNPSKARSRKRIILSGEIPSALDPPMGCRFAGRCWLRKQLGDPSRCVDEEPQLIPVPGSKEDHVAACHFTQEARSVVA